MGVLYNAVKQEQKRKIVLERLLELGVKESQDGINVYDLSYDDLKYELVLAEFRQIDVECSSNKWF